MKNPTELPAKNDLDSMYRDDARIAGMINRAIDLASQSSWQESEDLLADAAAEIEDWQPYDTSDSHYIGIWGSQITRVRKYISENNK